MSVKHTPVRVHMETVTISSDTLCREVGEAASHVAARECARSDGGKRDTCLEILCVGYLDSSGNGYHPTTMAICPSCLVTFRAAEVVVELERRGRIDRMNAATEESRARLRCGGRIG